MEDYNPSSTEVEETPVKRRRFSDGNFLRSWLEHRQEEDDDEEDTVKTKKSKKSEIRPDETEADGKPERLRDKFRKFFKSLVSLESIPATASEIKPPSESDELHEHNLNELLPEQTTSLEAPSLEDGLLAVSAEAQRRYYGHELADESVLEQQEEIPVAETVNIEANQPVEIEEYPEEVRLHAASEAEQQINSSAEPVGEVLHRLQTRRLERRVKKLRRRSRNIKHEQAEIKDRQEKFEKQLEVNQKAQERLERETIPKMEADRKKLRQRLENQETDIKVEIPEIKAIIKDKPDQKLELKTEIKEAAKAEVAKNITDKAAKTPEIIRIESLKPVIETLSDDGYSETYYERRHEVKDTSNIGYASQVSPAATKNHVSAPTPSIPPLYQPPSPPSHSRLSDLYKNVSPKPGQDMYRRAAANGAIGGLIILVLLAILMIIRM